METLFTITNVSNTRRAEMTALLDGLTVINTKAALESAERRMAIGQGQERKPDVLWYTDRQELAYAITPSPEGKLYRREKMEDMWARLRQFELWMHLKAEWVPRNTVPAQGACDQLCTRLRDEAKRVMSQLASEGIVLARDAVK